MEQSEDIRVIAVRITKRVYANRYPKPSGAFVGMQSLIQSFLEAGWNERQVERAFMTTVAYTRSAIELSLNKDLRRTLGTPNTPQAGPPRPVEIYTPEGPATSEQRETGRHWIEEVRKTLRRET